ncbi:coiled-coil domain-containing protein 7-like [Nycticebus coucang]|uniref:coiled-coil domain-containing protein 7-like n=1 Tax=Nycticebus coucang TaxID=9470 RepID=UPI00234C19C3|nr:coiled-coil domain-containing protein 7-like [Nycticebus coucang]
MLEEKDSATEIQRKEKKLRTPKMERSHDKVTDENIMPEDQDSVSKTQEQTEKEKSSEEERLSGSDKSTHQDSMSQLQLQETNKKTPGKGRRNTHFVVRDENLTSVQDSMPKFQTLGKKQITDEQRRRNTLPLEIRKKNIPLEHLLPDEKVLLSRSQSQTKKIRAVRKDSVNSQNMNELPGKSSTLEDVESGKGYRDQKQTSEADVHQELNVLKEEASELQDTTENLTDLNLSISDLIVKLDLNKVVETDIDHLKEASERPLLIYESKTQVKTIPGMKAKQLTDTIGRGITLDEFRKQSLALNETDVKNLIEAYEENLTVDPTKIQLKSLTEIYKTISSNDTRKGSIKGPSKTQSRSQLGMNLFKNKDMLMKQQDILYTRDITPSQFPTKVINVSPFGSRDEVLENSTSSITELPRAIHRPSNAGTTLSKNIQFPLLNTAASGNPKTMIIKQKPVVPVNTLPTVTKATKISTHKDISIEKSVHRPYLLKMKEILEKLNNKNQYRTQ